MKVVIVRNTPEAQVIQRFGMQNKEYYLESDIEAVRTSLTERGHEVTILEGDKHLLDELEALYRACADPKAFMVYNLAYGVQGECRYTQIPAMLELAGIPYVGSGPRAHTISLDKYVAKIVLSHAGLPTPPFALLAHPDDALPAHLEFPLIVKPQSESTSFGVKVVHDDAELRAAATAIFEEYLQPVLVEKFIAGTELNCGVLGNAPPHALPVLEIDFGGDSGGTEILSFDVKKQRKARHVCPARVPDEVGARVQELAVRGFLALGCRDIARLDFRYDAESGTPYILELNSMACIHLSGSYYDAARTLGMTHADMIGRVLDEAVARYERESTTR